MWPAKGSSVAASWSGQMLKYIDGCTFFKCIRFSTRKCSGYVKKAEPITSDDDVLRQRGLGGHRPETNRTEQKKENSFF